MIDKLIAFALKQRLLVGLALIGLVAWGAVSYQRVPIDAFPDVTNNQVQILTTVAGLSPIEVEKQVTYAIKIDRRKVARYCLNVSDMQAVIEIAVGGAAATTILEGDRRFDCPVRLDEPYRKDLQAINSILVSTPNGQRIPLKQLADIYIEQGPAQLSREDSKRRIVIQRNVSGRDIGGFVAEVYRIRTGERGCGAL